MNTQTDHAKLWQALLERDAHADGLFFYGVRTTGVFCRPVCKARRPRRENVEFFKNADAAVRAGYRACQRCQPLQGAAPDALSVALTRACRMLEGDTAMQTRSVAAAVGLSAGYFQRAFRARLGVTPQQYWRRVRAERVRDKLTQRGQGGSVTTAAYEAGYASSSRFYADTNQELGMRPAAWSRGGRGEDIRYAGRKCSIGYVLVAWTPRGVCKVSLGDSRQALVTALSDSLPDARLRACRDAPWLDEVVAAIDDGTAPAHTVPLDIRATAFQERVFQALRAIPVGETRSYAEVAESLGAPRAVRAVASACARNPVAILIPCHRVIRAGEQLGGYRWGEARKRTLLDKENRGASCRTGRATGRRSD